MAVISLPEDVALHIRTAIQLSNNRVHLRLLEEAQGLIALKLTNAAIIVTGAVLESILEGVPSGTVPRDSEQVAVWRGLRNAAAHPDSPQLNEEQATEMLRWVHRLLTFSVLPGDTQSPQLRAEVVKHVRGKYKFVPTSSVRFIERKAEELRLEHQ